MTRTLASQGRAGVLVALAAGLLASALPVSAQVQAIDPDVDLARDLGKAPAASTAPVASTAPAAEPRRAERPATGAVREPAAEPARAAAPVPGFDLPQAPAAAPRSVPATGVQAGAGATYRKDELVSAAQSVFGQGARNVAVAIGDVLKKQGEPNGYIVGQEGGGAFIFGLRYGSGTLHQKLQPERPVYWSGPSIGFDAGGSGGDTFVLVYNLSDPERLFKRFGAGEGQAYVVGGVNVGYLRSGNVVLIPVRMGVGVRLGVNAGYMKFSRRQNWVPF
jgi:hypothetical protein